MPPQGSRAGAAWPLCVFKSRIKPPCLSVSLYLGRCLDLIFKQKQKRPLRHLPLKLPWLLPYISDVDLLCVWRVRAGRRRETPHLSLQRSSAANIWNSLRNHPQTSFGLKSTLVTTALVSENQAWNLLKTSVSRFSVCVSQYFEK